jgi:uncharacterized membrane protein YphA (DoxX/SURF4 family)
MLQLGLPMPVLATVISIFMELPVAFAVAIGAFTRPSAEPISASNRKAKKLIRITTFAFHASGQREKVMDDEALLLVSELLIT